MKTRPPDWLVDSPPFIQAMAQPDFYTHRPTSVDLLQTHISYVFLAGDLVYKIKKPLRFAFLDFSTLDLRRFYCHEELRLNRRLAADTYRRVVAIRACDTGYELADADTEDAVEYAVEMVRLPQEQMFSEIVKRGEATSAHINQITTRLIDFHRSAATGPAISANGSPERLREAIDLDFSESARYRDRSISPHMDDAIQEFCHCFVAQHAALFRRRQTEGRIRECHGDFRAEHLCFADDLQIIDCIEFDARFRYRDVAAEIAFLAMDLDFLNHSHLASQLIEQYSRLSADPDLPDLVPFYQCHLAYIRGKVESLKSFEPEVQERERRLALESARRHFDLSNRYSWSYFPMVIAVCGLSGTGKTTLANEVAARTGFAHLSSDVVRKELAGIASDRPATNAQRADLYSEEQGKKTYAALLAKGERLLSAGRGVVLDATFQRQESRTGVFGMADRCGVPTLFVECRCDQSEVRKRLDERKRKGVGASDADWSIYTGQLELYQEFNSQEAKHRVVTDTTGRRQSLLDEIEDAARRTYENQALPKQPDHTYGM